MYSEKVGKIWTLSKNGAEVLTSCYDVGWNKQVGFNSTCFREWKYIRNQVLWNFGGGITVVNIVTNDLPYVLQQDNARPHTATYTRDWFTQNHVTVMEWPAASPDLNPIENVWQIMKDRVEKIQPENITDWKFTIMETWMGLDQNYIDSFVDSMQRRIAQCIERHGGLTDY